LIAGHGRRGTAYAQQRGGGDCEQAGAHFFRGASGTGFAGKIIHMPRVPKGAQNRDGPKPKAWRLNFA
jgi:hypothetical protein